MANLRTDYVDDELDVSVNENRRYRMIDNGDGTVSFEDVTEYLQQGDNYGSAEVNEQNETINQINVDLLPKSGGTMTGNLTLGGENKQNLSIMLLDYNGTTQRHRIWMGYANSGGTFYLYDNTTNKALITQPTSGIAVFNGKFDQETSGTAIDTTSLPADGTHVLTVPVNMATTDYIVVASVQWMNYIGAIKIGITQKTKTNFKIAIYNSSGSAFAANTIKIDWIARARLQSN